MKNIDSIKRTELKILSQNFVDDLYRSVKAEDGINRYLEADPSFACEFAQGKTEIFLIDNIELFIPDTDSRDTKDLENSILIYESLGPLNETQASDQRLWVCLTHLFFWDYMLKRWPVQEAKNLVGRITDRYFLRTLKLESLVRNGISRLWWYAHLTIDESRDDKYELTRILLDRAEIAVGILERTFGANRNIRFALLEFLMENPDIRKSEEKTRQLFRYVNLD